MDLVIDGLQIPIINMIKQHKDNKDVLLCCLLMLENVNNILELMSNNIELVTVPFSLRKVFDDVLVIKQVTVRDDAHLLNQQYMGDPTRLRQALIALVATEVVVAEPELTFRVPHDASLVATELCKRIGGQVRSRNEVYIPLRRVVQRSATLALHGALRVLVTRSAAGSLVQLMQCCTHLVARCKVVDPPLQRKWLASYDVVICAKEEFRDDYRGPVFIFTPQTEAALLRRLQAILLTSA